MNSLSIDQKQLAEFCQRNYILRLSLFGSVLRADFGPESDIDVLVEFDPEHIPGFLGIARMERELSRLLGGRRVDLRTAGCLSPYFRADVLREAIPQYVHG